MYSSTYVYNICTISVLLHPPIVDSELYLLPLNHGGEKPLPALLPMALSRSSRIGARETRGLHPSSPPPKVFIVADSRSSSRMSSVCACG